VIKSGKYKRGKMLKNNPANKKQKEKTRGKLGRNSIEHDYWKNGCSGENPCATFFPIAVTKGKSLFFPLGGRRLHCSLAQHASATLLPSSYYFSTLQTATPTDCSLQLSESAHTVAKLQ